MAQRSRPAVEGPPGGHSVAAALGSRQTPEAIRRLGQARRRRFGTGRSKGIETASALSGRRMLVRAQPGPAHFEPQEGTMRETDNPTLPPLAVLRPLRQPRPKPYRLKEAERGRVAPTPLQ